MSVWEALSPVVSMALPACAGWPLVTALWPGSPKFLRGMLGVGLGLGIAGTLSMVAIMLGASVPVSFVATESLLALLSAVLWIRNLRVRNTSPSDPVAFSKLHRIETVAFTLSLLLAAAASAFTAYLAPHGDGDAISIWNSRARFFFLGAGPLDMLPDLTAPDYPLLLPSLVVRGWYYSQGDAVIVPIALGIFFTAATVVILVCGLRILGSTSIALLAACLLAGTPFFISVGVFQTADIVVCFFITAAVALSSMAHFKESEPAHLAILSGLFTGLAACTKNEGTLFIVAMVSSQLFVMLWSRRWRPGIVRIGLFLAGLAPPLIALVVFRTREPVPSVLLANMTAATIQSRIVDAARHSAILQGYWRDLVHFGEWWINPLAALLLYAVWRRVLRSPPVLPQAWRFPALVVTAMMCGHYLVYLFSPYEAHWHVVSSLPRLLLQLWPSALLVWGLLVAPEPS